MPPQPTDRRTQRTQRLLQQALFALVGERGYQALSVQDIAERASLSRATFYLHYQDKEQLTLACVDSIAAELDAHLEVGGTAAERAFLLTVAALRFVGEKAEIFRALLGAHGPPMVQQQIRAVIAAHIERDLRAGFANHEAIDRQASVIATHTAGALLALIGWWLDAGMAQPAEEMARLHHSLVVPGIVALLGAPSVPTAVA
ncbi:MAG: TetR/AcrR family transcriptional regulator [Roseiflexaceae bacterium]|nr:TetR/AcrR family transcriptional regulator [Roseiflexaceae bacterium]